MNVGTSTGLSENIVCGTKLPAPGTILDLSNGNEMLFYLISVLQKFSQSGTIHSGVCVSGERVSCRTWWLDIPQQGALAGKGHTFEGMAIMFVSPCDDVSLQPGST